MWVYQAKVFDHNLVSIDVNNVIIINDSMSDKIILKKLFTL